jgi:hypothetical protein
MDLRERRFEVVKLIQMYQKDFQWRDYADLAISLLVQ